VNLMERRQFLYLGTLSVGGWLASSSDRLGQLQPAWADDIITPDAALQMLMEGNQRFVANKPLHPDQSQAQLKAVSQAQHPFATVLSCADSRVPAELVFDRGIGSIFDVRIAGNIATPEAIGSIEYAVNMLNTPLLVVMGHERCGAVTAAVQGKPLPGDIGTFVKAIQPAVKRVKDKSGDPVENALLANIDLQIERLKRSQILSDRLSSGKLKIVGSRYDLDTGKVTIL
jgi:carbonic anhydrase